MTIDYKCKKCNHRFEKFVRGLKKPKKIECPACKFINNATAEMISGPPKDGSWNLTIGNNI